jgi:hypothetical protein
VTHSYARNCQRLLDLNLANNRLGAFLHPIQKPPPPDSLSTHDVAADRGKLMEAYLDAVATEFGKQVKAYLQTKNLRESGVKTGDNAGVAEYLTQGARQ